MEKSKSKSVADIVVTYGVAVVSIIIAFTLGAYSLAGAIATFADTTAGMPSVFGILGSGSTASLITTSALAVFGAIIANMALKKIASSKDASALVASDSYHMINKVTKAFCYITAGAALVAAVAVLLGAVLSISNYTPWKSYLVGEVLPLIFTAGGLIGAGVMVDKFTKATIKPNVLAMAAIGIAVAGIALCCIAVLVKTHVDSTPSSTYRSVYESIFD